MIKVLVVDDSSFFCQQLRQIIDSDPEMKVIGIAGNGKDAIEKVKSLKPDVVTMDVEMPVMDGITAVKIMMKEAPIPVLMLSSLTYEGAKLTLDALAAGATDFLLKSYESLSASQSGSSKQLIEKLKAIANANVSNAKSRPVANKPIPKPAIKPQTPVTRPSYSATSSGSVSGTKKRKLLVIGSSTGGPVVVQKILSNLPRNFPIPIVIVQHMPSTFTGAFASRLNGLCQIEVKEATDRMTLSPGTALIAPGGKQIYFEKMGSSAYVRVKPEDPRVKYQPCVDISFASAAKNFSSSVLAIVLTGMGSDGRDGAKLLKQQNAPIWVQDEQSCVVYGMPMAVVNAGLADKVLNADDFANAILKEIRVEA